MRLFSHFSGFIIFLLLLASLCFAQTTGKIAGSVLDADNGEPLIGANVIVEGTTLGAAAGSDGSYFIINVPPGIYTVRIEMMGYDTQKVENFRISVNRTSNLDIRLSPTVLDVGEVLVVQASKVAMKKDQTSAIRNVSADEIDFLPVEDTGSIIEMQAGVVGGHFRGGRIGEVSYMIDGMQVDDPLSRSRGVDLDKDAVQDMEVIIGTFDAEYGNAMSGIVNLVTKEGGNQLHGKVEGHLANYFTSHDNSYIGLEAGDINRNQDYRAELHGPIFRNKLTFYANFRHVNEKNHLNGVRRFNVGDYTDMSQEPYFSVATGDSDYVPLSRHRYNKLFGKLTYKLTDLKMQISYSRNGDESQSYSHAFKYNPDGRGTNHSTSDLLSFQINHMVRSDAFYELKLWYKSNTGSYYVYEDPTDTRYVHDKYLTNRQYCGFYTGGQEKGYRESTSTDLNAKMDMTWQVSRHHGLKSGFKYTQHDVDNLNSYIRNRWFGTAFEYDLYEPQLVPDSTLSADSYTKKPVEISAYFQDKMEYDEMVIKFGARFDYFDPNTVYPSQRRNPDNKLFFEDLSRMSTYLDAEPKYQVSPRFGLTYQLAAAAMLHLSYGHFFQTPPFYALFQNNDFLVGTTNYTTEMGNGEVRPERTVQYEIGLWQELTDGMGIDLSLFYKDIYDLLTMSIYTTYNQVRYGVYTNKDYANTRGLEVKYDVAYGPFSGVVNYTLQYTRGIADNPTMTFTRAGENKDPISRLIPMNWDQRHTVNLQLSYVKKNYSLTLVGNYGSGWPYTFEPIGENPLSQVNLYPNNNKKPSTFSVDLRAHYDLNLRDSKKLRWTLVVYNLLDRLNEWGVNPQTGRANQAIVQETQLAGHRSDFNDYQDRVDNPASFSAPRLIKLGCGFYF